MKHFTALMEPLFQTTIRKVGSHPIIGVLKDFTEFLFRHNITSQGDYTSTCRNVSAFLMLIFRR